MNYKEFYKLCINHGLIPKNINYAHNWGSSKVVCKIIFNYKEYKVFTYSLENHRIHYIPYSYDCFNEWNYYTHKVYLIKNFNEKLFYNCLKEFIFEYKNQLVKGKIADFE